MSDNEDLLGEDLGDHSLADYNLGNEEEEQLLADDFEGGGSQNVPTSMEPHREPVAISGDYSGHRVDYGPPPIPYQPVPETECVVPNIIVEVPNIPPSHTTYAPYEPRHYDGEHAVPPAIPAAAIESPQIVPSEVADMSNGEMARERFTVERPTGGQRMPQVRDIPDTLDKVVIPRGRNTWRNPQFHARHNHPYRRNNMHRGNFAQRPSFPPPQQIRPPMPPRPEIRPEIRPDIPVPRPELIRPDLPIPIAPEISPERPLDMGFRPPLERPPFQNTRYQFRPDERPMFVRPNFERPNFERPNFERPNFDRPYPYPRNFPRYPAREIVPNSVSHIPQVTIRQVLPDKKEPEVRMLPVQLPPNLPPGGLAGKKVLINPHFKGNFQPPVDVLPAYIPTRIQKTPPLSPTLESKFGPVKDIDEAAERFIAEQRNALARAAARKHRSPQRYIENTTIEIENDLARRPRAEDIDLLRRQEEFIQNNRAGLRRRMRSPSPVRRSPSPRRSPDRRTNKHDESSEYLRRVREQQSLRERVLRAKELRRRRHAHNHREQQEKEQREREQKETKKELPKQKESDKQTDKTTIEDTKPDTTRKTPEREKMTPDRERLTPDRERLTPDRERLTPELDKKVIEKRDRSPLKRNEEVNSTCDGVTPPRAACSDDELELILGDIDGILSDDDDTGRFKDKTDKQTKRESPPKPVSDLRAKLPARTSAETKNTRQKIVYNDNTEQKKKEKSPPRRAVVTSSTKVEDSEPEEKKSKKIKTKTETMAKSRQRITFDKKEAEKEKETQEKPFSNRRVIIQRKNKDKSVFSRIEVTNDPTKPTAGIFSRAMRTAITDNKKDEPQIEYGSDSDVEDQVLNEEVGNIANVTNLPHGMTDTRLKTLAGNDVQSLILDKERRSAKITFKTTIAAESFKKKFNNKMVAASRLTVTLK